MIKCQGRGMRRGARRGPEDATTELRGATGMGSVASAPSPLFLAVGHSSRSELRNWGRGGRDSERDGRSLSTLSRYFRRG